jgi:CPA2 family monovalent cation:H+ antiporter-2
MTVALSAAFCGGLIARRFGLPPIVGYLLAGVVIGPFTPGFIGDVETINELAELGVIFLLFGVGLHFSLRDLWAVRKIAIPGALGQMALATAVGFALTRAWGWSGASGVVLGLAISIASTVVLLRGLMDQGLLNTRHGQAAVGLSVFQDLATVLILVLLPVLSPIGQGSLWQTTGFALLKAGIFAGIMLLVGARVLPWLLLRIAHTRSRELFVVAVVVIALGIALGAADLFGISLALGAFLAGVVISESAISHQVGAQMLPFRDTFAVLFFVSVGMLVNPGYLVSHSEQVLALTALIVLGKPLLTILLGFLIPVSARTLLVVSAGLSQIGEFSFIIGQAAVALGLLTLEQYSLILTGALLSILVNPFLFRAISPTEALLRRWPWLWKRLDRQGPTPPPPSEALSNHVVVVGYGRVGQHVVTVLKHLTIPQLVVEMDVDRVKKLEQEDIPTLLGDAANSEVLTHARLERARALVVTVPEEAAAELIVATAHDLAPTTPIIARASTQVGVSRLAELGAQQVIHPELEGGLEIVRQALIRLGFPEQEVDQYAEAVRRDRYETGIDTTTEQQALEQLLNAVSGAKKTFVVDEKEEDDNITHSSRRAR